MRLLWFLLLFCCCLSAYGAREPYDALYARNVLKPLRLDQVILKGELKDLLHSVARYYAGLNCDDLLKDYRERAGQPAPGAGMGFGYAGHSPFGQYMSGYARLYALTGDERFKEKALYLMREWGKTIEEDGYCFAARPSHITPYYYDKLITAMMDIYNYCGEPEALEYIGPITDWCEKNLDRSCKYGDTTGQGTGEWYTISDHLYKLYIITGDERYKAFARVWEYREWWDEAAGGVSDAVYAKSWHHAYSHVNSFNGLGGAYAATGDGYYLDTLKKVYEYMQSEQVLATGGYGPGESLVSRSQLPDLVRYNSASFETQCATWAAFKICKYLTGFTGEARYGDWTEKLIINAVCASLPMAGNGNAFYYSNYRPDGAAKSYFPDCPWTCCTGTRLLTVTDLANQLYFHNGRDIYVSQYFASRVSFELSGCSVTLECDTLFPEETRVRYSLSPGKPAAFAVCFRLPEWLAGRAVIKVNGKPFAYTVKNGWACVRRLWKAGDAIEIELPMELEAKYLLEDTGNPWAITFGHVAIEVKAMKDVRNPADVIDPASLGEDFVPAEADNMTWVSKNDRTLLFKPFYAYREGERYFLYLEANQKYLGDFSDEWFMINDMRASEKNGAWCEYSFKGKTLRYKYRCYDDCGICEVFLDGERYCDIDLYRPERDVDAYTDVTAEEAGEHTVKIVIRGKNPRSEHNYVNVVGFEVME
ncbi:MAG: glycoside hydrolase family 127 protein [Abditibacteriota bacterium]|nr:glycoside hydrolase family 127 protein [Abditibacteriota bacterium]